MVPIPPRDRLGDVLDTLRNLFRFTPGMAGTLGGVGVGVAKGFRDLPEWFKGHPDRTGMAGIQAPGQGTAYQSPSMIPPAMTTSFASRFNQYAEPGENPFINPSTGVAPAWAGGPSTWNQPRSTWAIPSSTPDYSW